MPNNTDWLISIMIIFFVSKDGESLFSQQKKKKRLGADCDSDHELLIAKFSLKMKKVRKITRPFRYDLNNIPYDLSNGSDKQIQGIRSDRVPEELWTEVCNIAQEAVIKTIPKKKKLKKTKWLSEEGLQIAE